MMKKNLADLEIPAMNVVEVLKVPGETFGGVRILEMDKKHGSNSNGNSSSSDKMTGVTYCALIGSRDDFIRCFNFSF